MYLSRLVLNPRSREVWRDLSDCREMHRTLLTAFPQADAGEGGARASFDLLYRVEAERRTGGVAVLVQSRVEPDWGKLPVDYCPVAGGRPRCKSVADQYGVLREGARLVFRLRANPTRRVSERSAREVERWRGKRVDIRGEENQLAWLQRKAERCGFRLSAAHVRRNDLANVEDLPNLRVVPEGRVGGLRRAGGSAARLTFGSVLFEGELIITDAHLFREALQSGIGSGKAFGFGLLSVAPAVGRQGSVS
jgi:CRISPR system Cascade subunit CasE